MKLYLALIVGILAAFANAHEISEKDLELVQFDQHPGREIPTGLTFLDANGSRVQLKDCFRGQPVVLIPGYFGCHMLCEAVADGVTLALLDGPKEINKDYRVVFYSIDPKESLKEAQAKRAVFLKRFARPGAEAGSNFLTGDKGSIDQLSDAIGYRSVRDDKTGEYAHPAGFVVIRPDAKIFRYFMGISFSSEDLAKALTDAAKGEAPPSPVEKLILLCFHYNPIKSPYGSLIMTIVRIVAVLTIIGVFLLVVRYRRRSNRGDSPRK